MQIINVAASYSRKLSDNNYGSAEASCSMSATIADDEDAEQAYAELFRLCKSMVSDRVKRKASEAK